VLGKNLPDSAEIVAAKLGMAVVMIHADMKVEASEITALKDMIEKELHPDAGLLNEITSQISAIPEEKFEMAYLGKILTDSLDENGRNELLADLFKIVRSDSVYDPYEDKFIRIIARYLFINHETFIEIKNRK
jgi:uncharacterized tellurite resistance protein B-like protein